MKPITPNILAVIPLLVMALWGGPALADDHNGYIVDGGIAMYYAMAPTEMILGHPKGHPETGMHGGVPAGRHAHHLLVALFDAESSERIVNAKVTATVTETGLPGDTKALEPMEIAGAMTYGNYFQTTGKTLYRVSVTIHRQGENQPHTIEFEYAHQ